MAAYKDLEIFSESTQTFIDITDYLAYGGMKVTRYDVDAPDAGRDMSGYMWRGRVAAKRKLECTCRLLKQSETQILWPLLKPEYITVRYLDPEYGTVTKKMYSNNHPASFCIRKPNGTMYWSGVTFPLVEA